MNHWRLVTSGFLCLAALPLLSQTPSAQAVPSGGGTKQSRSASGQAVHPSDGQRIFDQNCSRCHNAPEGFSPSISGTIVRHMRVRASLSKEDEKALLRFLNP
jgi:cytochrome c5